VGIKDLRAGNVEIFNEELDFFFAAYCSEDLW